MQQTRQMSAMARDGDEESTTRRARGLGGTLGVTLLGALLPGAGLVWTRRRRLGYLLGLTTLALAGVGTWYVVRDPGVLLRVAVDPTRLKVAAVVLGCGLLAWAALVATTYALVRPHHRPRWHSAVGYVVVVALCTAVAAPVVLSARYALVQADLVEEVFADTESATVPEEATAEDPWAGQERVNLLLLGGDGGVNRIGVRTDSMILVSMNTRTGRTTLFSLPRNLARAQFPVGSPLHEAYPDGFTGVGDPGNFILNAVYSQVPALNPGILGRSDNEGADALKLAVGGSLGLTVDYYLLVNLQGFRRIVDAMGGVSVNINEPIPVGGNTDLQIPPERYLQPGPDQRLDGFEALWYSRGRYGSDDYRRMERQRCMVDAIINEARPVNLIRRYQGLAAAGKRIVRTDIPRALLPAFVELSLAVKDAKVTSVAFVSSERFLPGDPDFAWMREVVRRALVPPSGAGGPRGARSGASPSASPTPGASPSADPGTPVEAEDICGYDPVS